MMIEYYIKEVPVVKKRRELWRTSASDILGNLFNSDEKSYELSEWNMWQSSNQDRFLVSKSRKSEIYCDILKNDTVKSDSVMSRNSVIMAEVS